MTQLNDFMKYDYIERVLKKADAMTWDKTAQGYQDAVNYLDEVLADLEDLHPHEVYINGDVADVNETTAYMLDALANALYDYTAKAIEEIFDVKLAYESELDECGFLV